jgi:hypothetical protein
MANNLIALVDGETVKLEGEALDELLAAQASATAKLNAEKAEAETKAQAKAVAQGKLAALGLTVEDLQALGL